MLQKRERSFPSIGTRILSSKSYSMAVMTIGTFFFYLTFIDPCIANIFAAYNQQDLFISVDALYVSDLLLAWPG